MKAKGSEAFKAKLGEWVLFPHRLGSPDELASMVVELVTNSWDVTAISAEDLMAGNVRFTPTDLEDSTPQSVFVEGRLR